MTGRIFISYRRDETPATAGRLYDRLTARFGTDNVFMDVDSIRPGFDFADAIETAVGSCDVVLAVMGLGWLTASDDGGRRKLDDPDDFVVLEIKAGLDRDIPVIPILVGGAAPPRRQDLPPPLGALARRQVLRLDHDSFDPDVGRLLAALQRTLPDTAGAMSGVHRAATPPPSGHADTSAGPELSPLSTRLPARLVRTFKGHAKAVFAVAFSPDGSRLVTAGGDKTAQVWNPETGRRLRVLTGHTKWVWAVAFSPDGRVLATASWDKSVRLWDPATGRQQNTLAHPTEVEDVAFSRDNHVLATCGKDPTVRLWDSRTGRQVRTLSGHTGAVNAVAFSPTSDLLATSGREESGSGTRRRAIRRGPSSSMRPVPRWRSVRTVVYWLPRVSTASPSSGTP